MDSAVVTWADTGLAEAIAAEKAAYSKYVAEKSGDTNKGRVSPKRVREAQLAWYVTLEKRMDITGRLGEMLNMSQVEVLIAFYADTVEPKKR